MLKDNNKNVIQFKINKKIKLNKEGEWLIHLTIEKVSDNQQLLQS
jgi:hypothetical protein